jgi:hypothetical protein
MKIALFISFLVIILLVSPLLVCAQNFQYVLGTDYYAPADVAMPQKGAVFTDPNFHTSIVRVTDKSDGYSSAGIENEYARADPESCNGSYVILRSNDGEYYLYDAANCVIKKDLENIVLGEEPEPRWDAVDPKTFYYIYGTELRSYNIETDNSTSVHDFTKEFPSAAYITTKVEGDASLDRRFWSFMIEDSEFNCLSLVVFDKTSNSIIAQKSSFQDSINWVSMDMTGKHCLVGYDMHVCQVFSRDLSTVIDLPAGANGHMDLALTADGKDVMVYQNNAEDWIAMADLDTGVETQLVFIPFNVTGDIGLHFSGNCAHKPGWVLVSTYCSKQAPPDQTHSWMDTQLFMVQLQQNPTVWRIAHTQAYTSDGFSAEKNYFAEAFATINKAGSKIYFGSNWNNFTPDYTDTYQVTLPSDWTTIAASTSPPATTQSPTSTAQTQTNQPLPLEYILLAVLAVAIVAVVVVVVLLKKRHQSSPPDSSLLLDKK